MRRIALSLCLVGLVVGVAASAALSAGPLVTGPHHVNFGTVTVGTTSPTVTLTFTNNSSQTLYWDTTYTVVEFVHGDDTQFAVVASSGCRSGVAAGASCTATASFAPYVTGHVTAKLYVVWDVGSTTTTTSTTTGLSGVGG